MGLRLLHVHVCLVHTWRGRERGTVSQRHEVISLYWNYRVIERERVACRSRERAAVYKSLAGLNFCALEIKSAPCTHITFMHSFSRLSVITTAAEAMRQLTYVETAPAPIFTHVPSTYLRRSKTDSCLTDMNGLAARNVVDVAKLQHRG